MTLSLDFLNEWKWPIIALGTSVTTLLALKLKVRGTMFSDSGQDSIAEKTVIITGANSGLGKATAIELCKRDARVILACRDLDSAENTVKKIKSVTQKGEAIPMHLDLASFKSIHKFCEEIKTKFPSSINVLINNAGVFMCPKSLTENGLEMQMGVNHFGHFLLTTLLLDVLKDSKPSRIVIISSGLHRKSPNTLEDINSEKTYDAMQAYCRSKLANNLFACELSRRVDKHGIKVACVRPGMVWTNLGRHRNIPFFFKLFLYPLAFFLIKSPWEGCQTILHCVINNEIKNGCYYHNCKIEPWSDVSKDKKLARELWDLSDSITQKSFN